jgi:hypothetical protein
MPWSETTKMRERMRLVLDAEGDLFTMTELCERYGISRTRSTGASGGSGRMDGGLWRTDVGRSCIART